MFLRLTWQKYGYFLIWEKIFAKYIGIILCGDYIFHYLYHTSSYIGQINEQNGTVRKNILIKCREGDKEAFRQVVRQYQRMVFSLALKMLCDEEEAKDTVQDTFVRVWQNIGEYDTAKSFV